MSATGGTVADAPSGGGLVPLVNWPALWHRLAAQCRDLRHLCGKSQMEIAAMAGVSQGAVSRLESGRLHRFSVTTVTKVLAALARTSETLDTAVPSHLLPPLTLVRQVLPALDTLPLPPLDPELAELLRLYNLIPRAQRRLVLQVMRPLLTHLSEWQ